jgi:hypothetical protein
MILKEITDRDCNLDTLRKGEREEATEADIPTAYSIITEHICH